MKLPIPAGLSRGGPKWFDLSEFPHYLIAGETGGGKSNYLHSVLVSLTKLDNVRLFLIDMKRMEFEKYRRYAYLTYKSEDALALLQYLRNEMENRMDTLAEKGCTHVSDYKGKMPYYVLAIDEFSQLSSELAATKEEKSIRKQCYQFMVDLIVMARAVGIHIIVATQRPDKDILPGQLKANIPCRICFKVVNETNSKIILDNEKAAFLPGDIPGRAIFQGKGIEREVQTYFMTRNPYQYLPSEPKTKPDIGCKQHEIKPY